MSKIEPKNAVREFRFSIRFYPETLGLSKQSHVAYDFQNIEHIEYYAIVEMLHCVSQKIRLGDKDLLM